MSEKKLTPMMQQYLQVKEAHPDCLVLFRLGDFYEMFFQDAEIGARELELTLTTRDRNKPPEERVPMCGVPHHAVQGYIAKLTARGYKVVICEQMEDPATAVGLVERDVTRIVTPGTVVDAGGLQDDANNFLAALFLEKPLQEEDNWGGIAFCDLSTGECEVVAVALPRELPRLYSELESRQPRELVCSAQALAQLRGELTRRLGCRLESIDEQNFTPQEGFRLMREQFRIQMGILEASEGEAPALAATGGLLAYLYATQRVEKLPHLHTITFHRSRAYMELDRATRRNLELTETLRSKERRGSLLWAIDRCKTPMGRRKLRAWLERPLVSAYEINERQKGVAALVKDTTLRETLRQELAGVSDLERILSRLSCGNGGARELLALADALAPIPRLKALLDGVKTPILATQRGDMDPLEDLREELHRALLTDKDPPVSVKDGNFIAPGYDPEVDRLHALLQGGGQMMLDIEARERARTGIKSLKVKYNKVFGYYIEVSNSYKSQVPEDYIRRQTLVNGERYITPELKQLEEEILTAQERSAQLEYAIFCRLRDRALAQAPAIQTTSNAAARLDVLCSFAALAVEQRYVRPTVDKSGILDIENGRHPVVERTLEDTPFVPNDTHLDPSHTSAMLITGPNMAGKSTYMRQVGLIVLLAQIGSFVPATQAHIGVVDRVFTRIGASDDLNAGQSTFMVEMTEVADILSQATRRSLVLLDEIGRGTSTYDGMSIARAVLEHCGGVIGCKTLFATHYHELTAVSQTMPQVRNYNIAAEKRGDEVVFLRKILPGGADESYGIEVARLAGVPEAVLERATALLDWVEGAAGAQVDKAAHARRTRDLELQRQQEARVPTAAELEVLKHDPDNTTPMDALALLGQLWQTLRKEGKA